VVAAKRINTRRHNAEALAVRICRECSKLDAGRLLRWHEAHAIEKRLLINEADAQAAYKVAVDKRWLNVVGEPVFSISLLEDGRAMIAKDRKPA
jgi:hypothetical protein